MTGPPDLDTGSGGVVHTLQRPRPKRRGQGSDRPFSLFRLGNHHDPVPVYDSDRRVREDRGLNDTVQSDKTQGSRRKGGDPEPGTAPEKKVPG